MQHAFFFKLHITSCTRGTRQQSHHSDGVLGGRRRRRRWWRRRHLSVRLRVLHHRLSDSTCLLRLPLLASNPRPGAGPLLDAPMPHRSVHQVLVLVVALAIRSHPERLVRQRMPVNEDLDIPSQRVVGLVRDHVHLLHLVVGEPSVPELLHLAPVDGGRPRDADAEDGVRHRSGSCDCFVVDNCFP